MTPEVSILIPVYNVEKYILKCLLSITSDHIINKCEIIICNDCTPDNSMQIINQFITDNPNYNIKIIEHKVNKKIAITRQDLLNAASGKYIIFVDSDDWVEPEYISTLYNAAEQTNADITTCNLIRNFSNKKIISSHILSSETNINIQKLISTGLPGYLPCKLLKRSVITDYNIQFDNDLVISEDMLFILKLLFHTKSYYNTNIPLYNYRIISSHSTFSEQKAFERIKCNQKVQELLLHLNFYDNFKYELAFRKIFTLIKAFSNAPIKTCHKYYHYFKGQSKLIKITNIKTFFYKCISLSIDLNLILLTDYFLLFFKIKNKIKNLKFKKF